MSLLEQRCETCLGMGYKGRWRRRAGGSKQWKIETCPRCRGRGVCEPHKSKRRTHTV